MHKWKNFYFILILYNMEIFSFSLFYMILHRVFGFWTDKRKDFKNITLDLEKLE